MSSPVESVSCRTVPHVPSAAPDDVDVAAGPSSSRLLQATVDPSGLTAGSRLLSRSSVRQTAAASGTAASATQISLCGDEAATNCMNATVVPPIEGNARRAVGSGASSCGGFAGVATSKIMIERVATSLWTRRNTTRLPETSGRLSRCPAWGRRPADRSRGPRTRRRKSSPPGSRRRSCGPGGCRTGAGRSGCPSCRRPVRAPRQRRGRARLVRQGRREPAERRRQSARPTGGAVPGSCRSGSRAQRAPSSSPSRSRRLGTTSFGGDGRSGHRPHG